MLPNDPAEPARISSLAVPGNRWSRLARLGGMASGVAGGMLAEGIRQFTQGKRPSMSEMLLTPANARRVAEQLAQLRGAAMKVGQLLSMDAGDLLPPELAEIMARLRAEAHPMPMSQLVVVLNTQWGEGWDQHFERFSFTPMAAASIGQVHAARTKDGRDLAIKVQYPGVRQSIDSDVDNVATLLRISGLLPKKLNIAPLLNEAKQQLQAEANYIDEGKWLHRYGDLLANSPEFTVPALHKDFSTNSILAMTYVGGEPIEALARQPQDERNRVAGLLFTLLFREIFEFKLIQTDPNFANYRYDSETRQVILLDFGATRAYPNATVNAYKRLIFASINNNYSAMSEAASSIGYFQADIQAHQRQAVLDIFSLACEPLRDAGPYHFGSTNLATRIRDAGMILGRDRDFWHTPPAAALLIHRKLGGLYLLAARLKAQVDVGEIWRKAEAKPTPR